MSTLRPSEVIKILKQCGESGVKTLKFQGLDVEFKIGNHSVIQPELNFDTPSHPIPHVPHNPYSHSSEPDDIGMLDLEDPFSAEHLMENGFDDSFPDTPSA